MAAASPGRGVPVPFSQQRAVPAWRGLPVLGTAAAVRRPPGWLRPRPVRVPGLGWGRACGPWRPRRPPPAACRGRAGPRRAVGWRWLPGAGSSQCSELGSMGTELGFSQPLAFKLRAQTSRPKPAFQNCVWPASQKHADEDSSPVAGRRSGL